jgi:hypothetical protein
LSRINHQLSPLPPYPSDGKSVTYDYAAAKHIGSTVLSVTRYKICRYISRNKSSFGTTSSQNKIEKIKEKTINQQNDNK